MPAIGCYWLLLARLRLYLLPPSVSRHSCAPLAPASRFRSRCLEGRARRELSTRSATGSSSGVDVGMRRELLVVMDEEGEVVVVRCRRGKERASFPLQLNTGGPRKEGPGSKSLAWSSWGRRYSSNVRYFVSRGRTSDNPSLTWQGRGRLYSYICKSLLSRQLQLARHEDGWALVPFSSCVCIPGQRQGGIGVGARNFLAAMLFAE